jgi:dTDP-4-dehydrorhamnose reductase
VTDSEEVTRSLAQYKPKVVIHLAAMTDLVFCESHKEQAFHVNSIGAYYIALAARDIGAKMVFVSTSGVFDGRKGVSYVPSDIPNPLNVYGHSKLMGEFAVRGVLEDSLIVRTSWIFGGGKEKDKKFIGKIIAQIGSPEIRAVTDKYGSPTYAKDLIAAITQLIDENRTGTVHVGGSKASRFEVAFEVIKITGSNSKLIPAKSQDFPGVYVSGEDESILSSIPMRPWQEALREYIKTEYFVG